MKVYVVKYFNYDVEVMGVYKNEEAAKIKAKELDRYNDNDAWVEAYDLLED